MKRAVTHIGGNIARSECPQARTASAVRPKEDPAVNQTMSQTIIHTARPGRFASATAASGIGLAAFTAHAATHMMPANDRHGRGGATNVVDYRITRKAG